jgi:hypothetical protein
MKIHTSVLRGAAGIAAGLVSAVLVYWAAAVIAMLGMRGVPLGSSGGPPTTAELGLHLLFAAAGSAIGGYVALRMANGRRAPALIVGMTLAAGAIMGFGKQTSNWPSGFGLGMGAACLCGAVIAAAGYGRGRRPSGLIASGKASRADSA